MDQHNINDLYESINQSSDERKILNDSALENEEKVNLIQNERYRLILTQNFLKSQILDTVECYNLFVDFINSIYVLKTSDDRDSQEILTWLLSRKTKELEVLQNITCDANKLEDVLANLNSENELFQSNKEQIAMYINEIKMELNQTHLKIQDHENTGKELKENYLELKQQNQDLININQELEELINQKTIEIENLKKNCNENITAEKFSLTTEYKLKVDVIQSEILEMEQKWKCEQINAQMKEDEFIKFIKDEKTNLEQELDNLKRECDAFIREFNATNNDIQILQRKSNEMDNIEKTFENEEMKLKTKQKIIENEINQKKSNNDNNLQRLQESKEKKLNDLKMQYNNLCLEQDLLKTKINQKAVVSSSQVTSSSSARFKDNVFNLSSDDQMLDDSKKLVNKKR